MAKPVALSLRPGDPAPSFSAIITNGTEIHSKDLLGKPVVIYFYPRDDTPGCTKEACGFRDQYADCLLYTSPSPRDVEESRMPSSA